MADPRITSGSSYTDKSPINSYQHSSPNSTRPLQQPISVNLEACRQAFLAVLASVCDPHLNTIHAVCAKFSESRGASSRYGDLHPPRPVERPLNAGASHLGSTQAHLGHALDIGTAFHGGATAGEAFSDDWTSIFSFPTTYLPPSAFIPSRGEEGLLSVPGLEPAHPVIDLELAAGDVWAEVICMVDISRTDIEDLASRLTTKIRCYGFGPVLMRQDVVQVCQGMSPVELVRELAGLRCGEFGSGVLICSFPVVHAHRCLAPW